jgi:hypothetical protein
MAHTQHVRTLPVTAASAFNAGIALAGIGDESVLNASSVNVRPQGLSIATVPSYGLPAALLVDGVGKALIAASVGAWSLVGVASVNGGLGPITASGVVFAAASGSTYTPKYAVGTILKAAAPGDYAPVQVKIEEVF